MTFKMKVLFLIKFINYYFYRSNNIWKVLIKMKNFIFPQIFKPVIEENSFNTTISQWHMTSRRIQT
jgi:hypothetical protein